MKSKIHFTKFKFKYVLLLLLIAMLFIELALARYVDEENMDTLYEASSFYFESDILSNSASIPLYTYADGIDTIQITLNNYIDDLRISDVETNYSVSITNSSGEAVKDKNNITISDITGTLGKTTKKTKSIQFNNLNSGTYIVTAKALSPYTKEIKGRFVITQEDDGIEYSVSDTQGSSVLHLTISTKDYSGNIKITWTNGISPDSTDNKLSNVNSGYSQGQCTVNFEANSEYSFQFFKQNPNIKYTKENFTVGKE